MKVNVDVYKLASMLVAKDLGRTTEGEMYEYLLNEYTELIELAAQDEELITKQRSNLNIKAIKREGTLVIHPQDATTDFLKAIYQGKDWDVVQEVENWDDVLNYERIVMLGHGSPMGLFGTFGFEVEDRHIAFLRNKQVVCIWCYAQEFVEYHHLSGFYTGMFISEVEEANLFDIYPTQEDIDYSNMLFGEIASKYIDLPPTEAQAKIVEEYHSGISEACDQVIAFNRERLFVR